MELNLDDVMQEYFYSCEAKGFTEKTMKNKTFECEHLLTYLTEKRGLQDLTQVTPFDLKSYFHLKKLKGNKPQSISGLYKIVHAFFSWTVKEEYLNKNPMDKVECPKVPRTTIHTFTASEVNKMIHAFRSDSFVEMRNQAILCMLADTGMRFNRDPENQTQRY
ncbi:phage integrase SAM-like domain-containing protein [Sporolactobacillus sp. CQH2019]|uniref:tyrosine-type recombinase/integrase n=1 Tax=Sporolactobacillus sp. CQH2019 TaxID=3023512 RepID=UPI0023685858|nr:phage integrase SAM-like domain-containing protein [Sporolactobacillus sp. CQH2019]MDD9149549.1 phage integrase SAM-like domain-containing protein [Sporolactobacillus sp. CQH2019]